MWELFWWKVKFVPQDVWIGVYWKYKKAKKYRNALEFYVCIVPCVPIHFYFIETTKHLQERLGIK